MNGVLSSVLRCGGSRQWTFVAGSVAVAAATITSVASGSDESNRIRSYESFPDHASSSPSSSSSSSAFPSWVQRKFHQLVLHTTMTTTTTVQCDAAPAVSATGNNTMTPSPPYVFKHPSTLRKRMTAIGRFSIMTETPTNPCIPTLMITCVGKQPLTKPEFVQLWKDKRISERQPRFTYTTNKAKNQFVLPEFLETPSTVVIDDENQGNEEKQQTPKEPFYSVESHVSESFFRPSKFLYRKDLQRRLTAFASTPFDTTKRMWEVMLLSSKPLGTLGSMSQQQAVRIQYEEQMKSDGTVPTSVLKNKLIETLILFRGHHVMADGVSLSHAFMGLCDEYEELEEMIHTEWKRRRQRHPSRSSSWFLSFLRWIQIILWMTIGSMQVFWHQLYLYVVTPRRNPFKQLRYEQSKRLPKSQHQMNHSNEAVTSDGSDEASVVARRSLSWMDGIATVDEVKAVAKALAGPKATVNDVWVTCVAYATAKQLSMLRKYDSAIMEEPQVEPNVTSPKKKNKKKSKEVLPSHINVVVPVHLTGGIILPGQAMGNKIGAMVARVPVTYNDTDEESSSSLVKQLKETHAALHYVKRTPAAFIAYWMAYASSNLLPNAFTRYLFANVTNMKASVVLTNVKSPIPDNRKLHLANGALQIESVAGFLPLPPGIPIGLSLTTYSNSCSLTINAESYAVPDADQFLVWTCECYQKLVEEMEKKKKMVKKTEPKA